DHDGAEALYWEAAGTGDTEAVRRLAKNMEAAGDHESADDLYRQVADAGIAYAQNLLVGVGLAVRWPYGLDPDGTPSQPWKA
ncbi:hypothetical protein ACFVBL_37390, partial [Streptomyces erythrochromogenes]